MWIRLVFGSAMVAFLVLGVVAIRRRDVVTHSAWVTRGYAIGQGAGTQALFFAPWTLVSAHRARPCGRCSWAPRG